jgi:uncharacterized membrane protein YjgN (DUF898 family)
MVSEIGSITEENSVSETSGATLSEVVFSTEAATALPAVVSAPVSRAAAVGMSRFDGGLFGLIGVRIVQLLITCITLGIGYPWAVVYGQRWIAGHTVIDGQRLVFTGTGGSLIGQYIKWLLLGIVTLGIYFLWIPINMMKWVVKNTSVLGEYSEENSSENAEVRKVSTGGSIVKGILFCVLFLVLVWIFRTFLVPALFQ